MLALLAGCATQKVQPPMAETAPAPEAAMPAPEPAPAVESFRAKAPAAAPTRPFNFPKVTRVTLDNGMRLLVAENHNSPLVSARVVVRSGADADPADHAGLATLTAEMLDEGAGKWSAIQIAEAIGNLGSTLFTTAEWDYSAAGIDILSRNLDEGMPLLAAVVMKPTFAQKEFDRVLKERKTTLIQQKDQAPVIAGNRFSGLVYKGTPYGSPLAGTEASVGRVTRGDVAKFHRTNYLPNNVSLIITGDITPDRAWELASRHFASWKKGPAPKPVTIVAPEIASPAIYLVDRPQAVQSEIRVGHAGVARSSEDYFPLLTMNSLLGGLFGSRINLNLREKHGYTYGARSGFSFRRQPGPFTVSTPVRNAVTSESVTEILSELRRIRSGDVTDAELDQAKNYLMGVFPATVQSASNLAARLADAEIYGLDEDYFDRYRERIAEVTSEDVTRVANKYLNPDKVAIVVVGKASEVREALSKLGPPVEVLDIEGKPVAR